MTITARLMRLSNECPVVAVGFLQGLMPQPVVLLSVNATPWSALQGLFVQAKTISDFMAPKRFPLTTIEVN